jgi:hypothetical protein
MMRLETGGAVSGCEAEPPAFFFTMSVSYQPEAAVVLVLTTNVLVWRNQMQGGWSFTKFEVKVPFNAGDEALP